MEWYSQFKMVCFGNSPMGRYERIEELLRLEAQEGCKIVQVSPATGVVVWEGCGHIYPFHLM